MKIISFRRHYLDHYLLEYRHLMTGHVLDIGGVRENRRGDFIPPSKGVVSWEYLNNDSSKKPDYCCDATSIPLNDESIDTVIFTEVLEYIPETISVLNEIYRIMNFGGHCVISIPFLSPIHGDSSEDRLRFTPVMLEELILKSNFKILKLLPMGSLGAVIYDILRVNFGYASGKKNHRISNKLLSLTQPFFKWVDRKTINQSRYINTGYFIIIKKEG